MTTTPLRAMTEGTQEQWDVIAAGQRKLARGLPERIMAHLRMSEGEFGGYAVDRLTHSLQAATRAEKAARSDEYVLCALLHDIGDMLASFNHQDLAAAVVQPFVSEDLHWMVAHHGLFQGYYFFDYIGLDKDARDEFRTNPYYDLTVEFCAEFDQNSFDPNYPTKPLEHFAPLLFDLMMTPKHTIYRNLK